MRVGGVGVGGGSWEIVALAAASPHPARSESESHVHSCRATRDRVGPNAAGRPHRDWTQAVESESHPSGEGGLRTLPLRNLPLRSIFKFVIASVSIL